MSDTAERLKGPKIRVYLKTGQKPKADAPRLRFMRWKLVPGKATAVAPDTHEEPGSVEKAVTTPFEPPHETPTANPETTRNPEPTASKGRRNHDDR